MKLSIVVLFVISLLTNSLFALELYVSPEGSDTKDGQSPASALATIIGARNRLREIKVPAGEQVTVWVEPGIYNISKSVTFTEKDSGKSGQPVVYRSRKENGARLLGGPFIPAKDITAVSDPKVLSRLYPEVRNKIRQVDLKTLGVDDYGELKNRGFRRPYVNAPLELFNGAEQLFLARYPNQGFTAIGKVLDKGATPRTGEYSGRGAVFHYTDERPSTWQPAPDIYASGNFRNGYADDTIRIEKMDRTDKIIHLSGPHMYGVQGGKEFSGFFFKNVLEEIDIPGEYYVDRNNGMLYVYPPKGASPEHYTISLMEEPILYFSGASNILFRDFAIECFRGIGVYIEEGENVTIAGGTIRNGGVVAACVGKGVEPDPVYRHPAPTMEAHIASGVEPAYLKPLSGALGSWHEWIYLDTTYNRKAGKGHGLVSCDIYNMGAGGVSLGGGDRKTLQPAGNYVMNCHIYSFNRLDRSYKAGVNIDGVGNSIRHCEINKAPGSAIYLHGNNHLIEYNHIHDTTMQSSDMGWFYMGRDPSEAGNVIRYNFAHHNAVSDEGHEGHITKGASGVYLDDSAGGMTIFGNIFYKCGRNRAAVKMNGGNDILLENNIFINCVIPVSIRGEQRGDPTEENGTVWMRLKKYIRYTQPPYATAYPYLLDYFEKGICGRRIMVKNNVYVNPISKVYGVIGKPEVNYEGNLELQGDPGFKDMDNMEFDLNKTSVVFKKVPGFKTLPFKTMGLIKDQYRKQ